MHIVRLVPLLVAVLVRAGVTERVVALEPAAVFARVSPSVWEVRVASSDRRPLSTGNAVVITDGMAITNCHVLRGGKQVWLKRGNVSYSARLQYPDVERDLCQLWVADFHAPAVMLSPGSTLVTGQKVCAVGNPLGLELTISEGLISSLHTDDEGHLKSIQTSAPISQGSSGGGLFDADGRSIGITDHQVVPTVGQNLNFAIPADWIADVLACRQKLLAQATTASAAYASSAQAAPPRHSGELGRDQQAGFDMYLKKTWPKIFVASDGDHYSWAVGQNAEFRAMAFCTERRINCRIYARDDTIVKAK